MSKISYILGEQKGKKCMTVQDVIKDIHFYENGLGWLTLTFNLEGTKKWTIYHLNEDPYQEVLRWFLQKGAEFGGLEEKISINGNTVSFDDGKTWISTYDADNAMKMLQYFKGKTVTIRCQEFRKNQKYLSEGVVSFDDGQTWFDIDARKKELDIKWYENGGRIGIAVR